MDWELLNWEPKYKESYLISFCDKRGKRETHYRTFKNARDARAWAENVKDGYNIRVISLGRLWADTEL